MATPSDAHQPARRLPSREPGVAVVLGVAVLAALGGFLGTGRTALVDTDEPRYAETARLMLATGDWVHPWFNGEPRHAKPALYYWLIAGSYLIFGLNEFAARLPGGVFSALIGLGLFLYGRRRGNALAGASAFLVWATMLQTGIWSRAALTDVVLTFFLAGGALSLLAVCECTGRARVWAWLCAGGFMGLTALTKGPVGLVIPLGAYVLHVRSPRVLLQHVREGRAWLAGLVFLAIAAPWYIAQVRDYGMEYITVFLGGDNLERFAEGPPNQAGWWSIAYYLPVALVAGFPWTWLLPSAWAARRALPPQVCGLASFCTAWLVWTVALFSLSHTKQPQYIQSAYVPAAILVGLWVARPPCPGERRLWSAALGGLSAVLVAGAVAALPLIIRADAGRRGVELGPDVEVRCWAAAGLVALLSALVIVCFVRRMRQEMLLAGALCGWLGAVALLVGPGAVVAGYRVEPFREAGQALAGRLAPGARIVTYGHGLRNSALVYYSGHGMDELLAGEESLLPSRVRPGDAVVTRADRESALPDAPPRTRVGTYGGWVTVFVVGGDRVAPGETAPAALPRRSADVQAIGGER